MIVHAFIEVEVNSLPKPNYWSWYIDEDSLKRSMSGTTFRDPFKYAINDLLNYAERNHKITDVVIMTEAELDESDDFSQDLQKRTKKFSIEKKGFKEWLEL